MAYSYMISPIAADEYEETFTWYEERSVITADSFIVVVAYSSSSRSERYPGSM